MKPTRLALSLTLAALLSLAACTPECSTQVLDGWVRLPPAGMQHGGMPGMSMMAGFGRIENRCGEPATVVSASSPAFADVSLHETRTRDGISRMRPVPALNIAANGVAVLEPGSLHLMLMQPRASIQPGDRIPIQFTLADGRILPGQFEARRP